MKEKFRISRLGLGTVQFGMDYGFSKTLSQAEVDGILAAAHEAGIDFLDTARDYGDSEKKVGDYCRRNPGRFTVATKLARIDEKSAKNADTVGGLLENSIRESKAALGDGAIPLLFLHQTDAYVTQEPLFWKALERIKQRHAGMKFGVSVYDTEPTEDMLGRWGDLIDCIQAPYNLIDRRFASLAGLFQRKGIVFISRSTFLKGALTEERIPAELEGLEPVRRKLREISGKSGFSVSQLLTRFALDASFVDCTLIGVRSTGQLRENLDLGRPGAGFEKFNAELSDITVDDPFLRDPRKWKTL